MKNLIKKLIIFYRCVFLNPSCKYYNLNYCYTGCIKCEDCIKKGYVDLIIDMNEFYNGEIKR